MLCSHTYPKPIYTALLAVTLIGAAHDTMSPQYHVQRETYLTFGCSPHSEA